MKSKYIIPVLALGIISATSLGGVRALAADTTSPDGQTIVQKIAKKFNLKESDVQQVFTEDKAAHQAQRQQKLVDRLNQAVTDGKITKEQKDKIVAKQKELQANGEADKAKFKDMTPDERRAEMDKRKTELETWAKDNDIDMHYLKPGMGHRGFKGGHPGGPRPM